MAHEILGDMIEADHLRIVRPYVWFPLYYHHMIFISEREGVIHFTSEEINKMNKASVKKEDVKKFRQLGAFSRVEYDECLKKEDTIERAMNMLKTQPYYHVTENNCEHLATECKTGIKFSLQIDKLRRFFTCVQKVLR